MADVFLMNLKILLPFCVFAAETGLSRLVVETRAGSMGILPRRMDCLAALRPGILEYTIGDAPAVYLAVDGGILIKSGFDVLVSVRNAVGGESLADLQNTVEQDFLVLSEQEERIRSVMTKMEGNFMQNIVAFSHEN